MNAQSRPPSLTGQKTSSPKQQYAPRTRLWWIGATLTFTVYVVAKSVDVVQGGQITRAHRLFSSIPWLARFFDFMVVAGLCYGLYVAWRKVLRSYQNGGDNEVMRSGWWFSNWVWALVWGAFAALVALYLSGALLLGWLTYDWAQRGWAVAVLFAVWSIALVCGQDTLWLYRSERPTGKRQH
jgi:hypothetical protein